MPFLIKSKAPLRISFGGGGTDIPPFPERYGGVVLSATIDKYIKTVLKFRKDKKLAIKINGSRKIIYPDINKIKYDGKIDQVLAVINHLYKKSQGIDIEIKEDINSCGLGGSSSLFVSLIGAFNELLKNKLNKYQIAKLAFDIERKELTYLGGKQDQYAAAFGGINWIEFKKSGEVRVIPLKLPKKTIRNLEKSLILFKIGKRKSSEELMKEQIKNTKTKKETIKALCETKKIAFGMKKVLFDSNLEEFGRLLDKAWQLKKKFSSLISNKRIDFVYEKLKGKGALGGKICGAGGGGFMLILCEPNKKNELVKEIRKLKLKPISFKFEFSGLLVKKLNKVFKLEQN